MADSEISTTLPFVTRRDLLLKGTAVVVPEGIPRSVLGRAARGSEKNCLFDPAVLLSREWSLAHRSTEALCRKQQRLEKQLLRNVGFRASKSDVGAGEGAGEWREYALDVSSPGQGSSTRPAPGPDGEPVLDTQDTHWDREDRRLGYSAALDAERDAAQNEQELLDALMAAPATTLTGVAAKLEALLCEGQPCDNSDEFPWPHIRSVLADLERLGAGKNPRV